VQLKLHEAWSTQQSERRALQKYAQVFEAIHWNAQNELNKITLKVLVKLMWLKYLIFLILLILFSMFYVQIFRQGASQENTKLYALYNKNYYT
jgi:hypothetical protein